MPGTERPATIHLASAAFSHLTRANARGERCATSSAAHDWVECLPLSGCSQSLIAVATKNCNGNTFEVYVSGIRSSFGTVRAFIRPRLPRRDNAEGRLRHRMLEDVQIRNLIAADATRHTHVRRPVTQTRGVRAPRCSMACGSAASGSPRNSETARISRANCTSNGCVVRRSLRASPLTR